MPLSKLPIEKLITTFLGCLVVSLQVFGQETKPAKPPPQPDEVIRIFTDLVQTDVMVFDKEGRFVNGLKREDFALRVDGTAQPIEFFDRVAAGSAKEAAQLSPARGAPPSNPSLPGPIDRGRTILFYVDDFHMSPGDLIFLRKALLKFIEDDLGQSDEAVITSASGQIGFLQQLTDNKVVLRSAVMRIKARAPSFVSDGEQPPMNEHQALVIDRSPATTGSGSPDPLVQYFIQRQLGNTEGPINPNPSPPGLNGASAADVAELRVRARARAILEQAAHFMTNMLANFESLVNSSAHLPGRKLVFFISDGFYTDRRNSDTSQRIDEITRKAIHNGVVIYSLDARALTTGHPQAGEPVDVTEMTGIVEREQHNELSESREGMTVLAVETGGRTIFDTNALDTGLANAVRETSVYYLLGWRANHEMQTARKPPRIEVSLVNRSDLSVRLGHGFATITSAGSSKPSAAKREGEKPSESKLRDALVGIYPSNELPVALDLQFQNTPRGMLLTASMQVPTEALATTTLEGKEKAVVDLGGFVYDDQGKVKGNFIERGTVTPAAPGSNTTQTEVLTFNYSLSLSPGLYQVRVGARDVNSGRIGSTHEWIEIPHLSARELGLSTILAGERAANPQNESPQPPRINMRADHHFHRGASLRFQFNIYNAKVGPGTTTPDLMMEVQALRDRQPVITIPARQIPVSSSQATDQIRTGGEFSLKDLTPGRYVLFITVIDRIAKTSASQQMKFEIE